jgi:multiple sugar transport system substrate-binding protein
MSSLSRVTRRRFLKHSGLTVLAAGSVSAPFVSRALADTKTLTMVQWSHFVPAYDKWFDQFAKDWGTKNNIEVTVDHVPVQNVASRAAAEASAGSGHDMFQWNGAGGPHLYRKFLVDVTSLVEDVEKKHGKVSVIGRQIGYNQDDKTWSAYPDYYVNFPVMYRKSLWEEVGVVPDTWDNIRVGGAKLKAKGHPVGISLGHSNDPETTWRGLLWSYGASEQDETGKRVTLDSKGGRGGEIRRNSLQGGDDIGRAVLERRFQQPVHRFRRQLSDRQPDFGLPNGPAAQQEGGRRHLPVEAAKGPGRPIHG